MSNPLSARDFLRQAEQHFQLRRFREGADCIRAALAVDRSVAGSKNIRLSQLLTLGADWDNITKMLPRNTNSLVSTGWLNSLVLGRPVNAEDKPVPWFTYPAIDFLEPRINPEWSVLEWGCGNSTLWWGPRVQRVLSVENDAGWYKTVADQAPNNVTVALVEDESQYVSLAGVKSATEAGYDVIVIDGKFRNECARVAVRLAEPNSIIIFDNSDRLTFREGVAFLTESGWKRIDFFGLIPSYHYRNCTSVFYRDDALLVEAPLPSDVRTCLGPTCSQAIGE